MGNVSSIIIYILSSLFHYKELKMALINLDLHYITLFWQLKFWAGFCELLVWKSSIQSGNTDSALCSLLWSRVMDVSGPKSLRECERLIQKWKHQLKHWPRIPLHVYKHNTGRHSLKRSFLVNDVTEFTGNLKPMCEWCFSGKKTERCYLCEQHIFEFTGKVVPVILWQFTGITVWKGL